MGDDPAAAMWSSTRRRAVWTAPTPATSPSSPVSDNNKEWVDCDSVVANESAVTDRVLSPFSARFVRLVITKPVADSATDKTARVYELEVHHPVPETGYGLSNIAAAKSLTAHFACSKLPAPRLHR